MIGCFRKLSRLFKTTSGRVVLLPLDHGVHEGMVSGLDDIPGLLEAARSLNVQGAVLNKGAARTSMADLAVDAVGVVQLSAGTRHASPPYAKAVVCSVSEALRLGADMVALQVNMANEFEDRSFTDMGLVVDEAHSLGVPVLAMIRPVGDRIVNEKDPSLISHCVRLGAELGADVTGAPYSGDPESFAKACAFSPVPVLVTGGPSRPDFKGFLSMVAEALNCGASGTCIGRNIFQNPDPAEALRQLTELVHTPPEAPASEDAS